MTAQICVQISVVSGVVLPLRARKQACFMLAASSANVSCHLNFSLGRYTLFRYIHNLQWLNDFE